MIPRPKEYTNWKDWAFKVLDVLDKADILFKKTLKSQVEISLTITGVVLAAPSPIWEYDERNGRFSIGLNFVAPGAPVVITITGLDLTGKTKIGFVPGVANAILPAVAYRRCQYVASTQSFNIYVLAGDTSVAATLVL